MASKKNIGFGVAAVAAAGAGAALAAKSLKKHANVGLEQGQVTQDGFDGEKAGKAAGKSHRKYTELDYRNTEQIGRASCRESVYTSV